MVEEPKVEKPKAKETKTEEPALKYEVLRSAVLRLSVKRGRDVVEQVLGNYGVASASKVPEERWPELLAEVQAATAED